MNGGWWMWWIVILFVFIAPPLGYGWGYRGWGLPYPRYVQRRRAARSLAEGGDATVDHHAWSWGGDVFWTIFSLWILWAVVACFAR